MVINFCSQIEMRITQSNEDFDSLYNDWVEQSKRVFEQFSDADFFGDKVQHIYFYGGITNDKVSLLYQDIMEASKSKEDSKGVQRSPKPIVIHLDTPGGSAPATHIFNSMIFSQRVPLAVVVENLVASAGTFLALLAPYRVMISNSLYLIHDAYHIGLYPKSSETLKTDTPIYQIMLNYINLLKRRTNLNDTEIQEFMERDIFIGSDYCKEKKIVDRVLEFPQIYSIDAYTTSALDMDLSTFLKKTNHNHIYFDDHVLDQTQSFIGGNQCPLGCVKDINTLCTALDGQFLKVRNKSTVKPIIIHFRERMDFLGTNVYELTKLNYRLALIQRCIPIVALLEGTQYLDTLQIFLMCPYRLMMTPSTIQSSFAFAPNSILVSMKTIDIIANSQFVMDMIEQFLKRYAPQLPKSFYKDIRRKVINLGPSELKRYGIIHKSLVSSEQTSQTLSMNDIMKYLHI